MRLGRRFFTLSISALAGLTVYRLSHSHDILGRLAAGHPEPTHERIGHLGGEAVANRRSVTEMSIKDAINLLLGQPFGLENIYQSLKSHVAGGFVDDVNDAGAGCACAAY